MKKIIEIVKILLAMGGILVDKFSISRIMLWISLAGLFFFNRWLNEHSNLTTAVIYFYVYMFCRYVFLFGSFTKDGIASKLKRWFDETKGFEVYQFITALMFFQSTAGFTLMVNKTVGAGLPVHNIYEEFFIVTGVILVATGFIINLWSTLLIGIDVYYYKDLFLGRAVSKFEKSGPYLYLSNPMYGLGQANGYGTAIIHASVFGIGGIFLNQVLMYIFYYTIEKPHIKKVFSGDQRNS